MIDFHPGAKTAFATAAEDLLKVVKVYPDVEPRDGKKFNIHPNVVIQQSEIIGTPKVTERTVDRTGTELGRFWSGGGHRFGWAGEDYQKLKRFAERIARSTELEGLVSEEFILDQAFEWLCETLESKRCDSITDFVSLRCSEAIRDHEIYIPLCRTYSSVDFAIGDVEFKSISKAFLDGWFPSKPLDNPDMDRRVRELENDTRAKFQATLAACVKVRAEAKAASQQALTKALRATALLRFLSIANWTSKVKSFALPLGMENSASWHSFNLDNGVVKGLSAASIFEGPYEWVTDEARAELPGLLECLSDLASSQSTDFRKTLLDAMLIYSRNSTTTDPANKLVFILVALESMLLKDASEPIQGNLGERMAFLVGASLEARKNIVSTVRKTYAMRSKFIHHGQGIDDLEVFDAFLFNAWSCFSKLLELRDRFKTRLELIGKLDEMKLS
jgi:hypothetical protein